MFTTESLEARQMMTVTATVANNTLYVAGDEQANGIALTVSGNDLLVKQYTGNGAYKETHRFTNASVKTIRVYGNDGADTITIDNSVKQKAVLIGGRGADWIKAGGGETTVWGHHDTSGGVADDSAADTLISGHGMSYLHGQKGADSFFTNYANTAKVGMNDYLFGGDGDDKFYMDGVRAAYVMGENGNDRIIAGKQEAALLGGTGNDTVDFSNFNQAIFARPDGSTKSGVLQGIRNLILGQDIETVRGTKFNDMFYGTSKANYFYAGDGNDSILGFGGNDKLYGEAGDDTIYGGTGNDLLVGGAGSDYLDSVDGVAGNDVAIGGNADGSPIGYHDMDELRCEFKWKTWLHDTHVGFHNVGGPWVY